MKCPCYNAETKTDCLKRSVGCHSTCSEWNTYEKERNDSYKTRLEVRTNESYLRCVAMKHMLNTKPRNITHRKVRDYE